jgi:hypothetical protein
LLAPTLTCAATALTTDDIAGGNWHHHARQGEPETRNRLWSPAPTLTCAATVSTRPAAPSPPGHHHQAREGLTMCDPRFWIEVLIVILRIFSAGLSS